MTNKDKQEALARQILKMMQINMMFAPASQMPVERMSRRIKAHFGHDWTAARYNFKYDPFHRRIDAHPTRDLPKA